MDSSHSLVKMHQNQSKSARFILKCKNKEDIKTILDKKQITKRKDNPHGKETLRITRAQCKTNC